MSVAGAPRLAGWWLRRWPGRFYGPAMLSLASLLVLASMSGQSFLLGQFKLPMQGSFGLSAKEMAGLYLVATLLGGLTLGPCGWLIDRLGMRRSVLTALPGLAAACLLCAVATHWAWLLVGLLGLRMLGQGLMELLSGNTVAMWYDRRLGRAAKATMLTFALGLLVVAPLVPVAIDRFGWRVVYAGIGLGVLALAAVMAAAYVPEPSRVGQAVDGAAVGSAQAQGGSAQAGLTLRQAAGKLAFWVLGVSLVLYALLLTAGVFCVNGVAEARGLPPATGAWTISALGGGMAASYPALGWLADRWAAGRMQALATASLLGATVALAVADGVVGFVIAGLGFGLSISAQGAVGVTAWPRFFGRKHLGGIRGTAQTAAVAGSSVGPLLLEWTAELTDGYPTALLWMALAGTPCLLAGLLLPRAEANPSGVDTKADNSA